MQNKIACAINGYQGHDLNRVLQGVSGAGFRYVEITAIPSPQNRIAPEQMNRADIARFRSTLAGYGLTPVSVSGHSDLTRRNGVDQFKARIDFTAKLEVDILNTGTGHADSSEEEEHFFSHMIDEIIPYAAERGVRIALETHGGLTGTADDCLRTLEKLQSDWVGINYDPANVIYYRGVLPEDDIRQIAPQVIHVHMKDQRGGQGVLDFPPLGEGTINFASIVETLGQSVYGGPFSAEIEMKDIANVEEEDEVRLHNRQFMERIIRAG